MQKRKFAFVALTLLCVEIGQAQLPPQTIPLPAPDTAGGKPLMQVLKERKSTRAFVDRSIPPQMLSNLLWAAFGINRPDGRRTAPSALNRQEINIYLFTSEGVFLYNAKGHSLGQLATDDLRAKTGTQDFVGKAPLNLVYVADIGKIGAESAEDVSFYTGADCGFIAQNVYLFCASEGLGVVVRGLVDRSELKAVLKLSPNQRILLAQTVGYVK